VIAGDEVVAEVAKESDAEVKADAELVAEDPEPFMAQYVVAPVEGYTEKMAAFAEQKAELRQKLNGGDLFAGRLRRQEG